jgi:hypothetical protein
MRGEAGGGGGGGECPIQALDRRLATQGGQRLMRRWLEAPARSLDQLRARRRQLASVAAAARASDGIECDGGALARLERTYRAEYGHGDAAAPRPPSEVAWLQRKGLGGWVPGYLAARLGAPLLFLAAPLLPAWAAYAQGVRRGRGGGGRTTLVGAGGGSLAECVHRLVRTAHADVRQYHYWESSVSGACGNVGGGVGGGGDGHRWRARRVGTLGALGALTLLLGLAFAAVWLACAVAACTCLAESWAYVAASRDHLCWIGDALDNGALSADVTAESPMGQLLRAFFAVAPPPECGGAKAQGPSPRHHRPGSSGSYAVLAGRASWWALLGHGHLLRQPAVRAACRSALEVTLPMLDLERALTRNALCTRLRFSRRTYAVGDTTFRLPRQPPCGATTVSVRTTDPRRVAANLRLARAFGAVAAAPPEAGGGRAPKVPVARQHNGALAVVSATAVVADDTLVVALADPAVALADAPTPPPPPPPSGAAPP